MQGGPATQKIILSILPLDFFRNSIRSVKPCFLAPSTPNFSAMCIHMAKKLGGESAQKSLVSPTKANFERSLLISCLSRFLYFWKGSLVLLNHQDGDIVVAALEFGIVDHLLGGYLEVGFILKNFLEAAAMHCIAKAIAAEEEKILRVG